MALRQSSDHIISTPNVINGPTECVGKLMFKSLLQNKDKIAQIDAKTGTHTTFGELLQQTIRTALYMKDKGITENHVITLCTKTHMNAVIPFIATQFIGAKTANIDPSFSRQEMEYLLNTVQPKLIFASSESEEILKLAIENISLNTEIVIFGESKSCHNFTEFLQPHEDEDLFKPLDIKNLLSVAMIFFSSGTTGLPKAISISHHALIGQLYNNRYTDNHDHDFLKILRDKINVPLIHVCCTTMYWFSAAVYTLRSIIDGFCRLVWQEFDEIQVWEILEKYKVASLSVTPIQVIDMFAHNVPKIDTSHLLTIFVLGSSLPKTYLQLLRKHFPETAIICPYGQTETVGAVLLFNFVDKNHRLLMFKPEKIESVGLPIRGMSYKVVDLQTKENLGPNKKGELYLKGNFFMNGYCNADTSEAFDSEGWLKTGDIVYYDQDFCFYVVDRIKEAFKYQGWFIAPVMLEGVLLSHPAVKLAIVIGIPKDDGHHPMGLVVLHENSQATEKEIEKFVEDRVPDRQRLRAGVKFINDVPLTVTGKVNRNLLKQRVLQQNL